MNEYLTDPLALAVLFHVTYERLAPQRGYETRTDTRVFDPESKNGKLTIAVCAEVQEVLRDGIAPISPQVLAPGDKPELKKWRMGQFRKKPVVVQAVRVAEAIHAASHDWEALPAWLRAAYDSGRVLFLHNGVSITTLEGTMQGDRDDWIIRGVSGELYPCKPEIFAATYDPVPAPGDKPDTN
jgi:hypothetical protein